MPTSSLPRLLSSLSRRLATVLCIVLLITLAAPVMAQEGASCSSQQSGLWSNPGTWDCGHVPGDGDDVTIVRDHTIIVDTNTAVLNSVTVAGALRFESTGGGMTIHVKGDMVIAVTGALDVIPGGVPTEHSLIVDGALNIAGIFMPKTEIGSGINVSAAQINDVNRPQARPWEKVAISADGTILAQPSSQPDEQGKMPSVEPSTVLAAGDGVPIAYYDFELDSSRTTLENAVDQAINSGNSALARTGGSGSLYGGTGAGKQFSRSGPVDGMALESAFWPTTTTDPGTSATNYIQVSLNTSGFSGISLAYDLFTGTTSAGWPYVGTLVSYNGGSSWSVLQSGFGNGNNTWSHQAVALTASGDDTANLRIRFYGYYSDNLSSGVLRLDNLTLFATGTATSAGTKTLLDEPGIYTDVTSGLTGSVYVRTGTITFSGSGTTVVFGSNWAASGTVAVSSGATLSTGGASGVRSLLYTAAFTLNSGTTLEINSVDGITSSGAVGNIQTTGTRTFSIGANYVYNGTSAQVTGNGLPATVNHLTINNAAGVTLSQAAAVNGNLTISSGTLDVSSSNYGLTLVGNWINNGGFNARSGTVTFDGTTSMSGSSATSLNNVVINSSKSLTAPSGNLNVAGNWTNNGTFTHNSGTVTFNGTTAMSGSSTTSLNNVVINSSQSLTAPSGNLNVAGNWTNNGTFTHNSGTVTFNGTTSMSGSSTTSLNTVVINSASSLTAPSGNLNVAGNWTNNGTFTPGSGMVTFNGGSQTIIGSIVYNYTKTESPVLAIPDNSCPTYTESSLTVADSFLISDLNVTINIIHTYDADLDIYLVSPADTVVELSTNNGSSGDNYTNTTFDDEAATSITLGSAPFTGTYKPEGLLSSFDGQNVTGTWKLRVCDDVTLDTGSISS